MRDPVVLFDLGYDSVHKIKIIQGRHVGFKVFLDGFDFVREEVAQEEASVDNHGDCEVQPAQRNEEESV